MFKENGASVVAEKLKKADLKEYRALPFWSWNDKLEKDELVRQIKWMKENGFGGYFMHARGGLTTEYLSEEWFDCINACLDAGEECGMESWAYDENGWPSGFVGGKLLENPENCDKYLRWSTGEYDPKALVSYLTDGEELVRTNVGGKGTYLNVYEFTSISSADVLNPDVVEQFITLTHEEYKKHAGDKFSSCKGFFTDEPQYFRKETSYTKMIVKHFEEVYGEDILDKLGLLFVEKKGYREFRYRYWKGMQSLMLENFAKKVYDWCVDNGVGLTGHYIEEVTLGYQMICCAGIMPFYEFETIPGVDHLGRRVTSPVVGKQVSSVAKQLGKKRVLTETFACCGWDGTPREFKAIAESQYVNGVNLMCQHLLPYSEHGQRKRDYPAHFSWVNPWVRKDFKSFNDYFAKLGYLLASSEEPVSVGLFVPIRSVYFDYKREGFDGSEPICSVDRSYVELSKKLSAMNIAYHMIDETILEKHGKADNGKLIVGQQRYDFLIFPETITMDAYTCELLEKYYSCGGKMLFTAGMPTYLEGKPHNYKFKSNVSMEEIVKAQRYSISSFDSTVQSTYRIIDGIKYIYAVNLDFDNGADVTFTGDFSGFTWLNLETLETKELSTTVHFEPCQSYVLFLNENQNENVSPKKQVKLGGELKIVDSSDNYFTLDKLQYSLDGENYSEKLRYMGVFDILLNKRYCGDVYLKYTFNIKKVPKTIYFLAENMLGKECVVNGKNVTFTDQSVFEKKIHRANISDYVVEGVNEVIIKINFYESEEVYYVLFGENVTEGLKNKLAYDTTIESCYLQGDFGVYSEKGFVKGKEKNVLISNDFYIAERKNVVTDPVAEGYPFFAGDMTFEGKITVEDDDCALKLDGRYCLAEVYVNGKKAEKSYFGNVIDLKGLVSKGENTVKVTLWSGNRNLLGPHHYLDAEEPFGVGPYTFELIGSWKDGKSSCERDDYAFVKFGLFDQE